jgi:hypothetical protein
LAVKNLNLTKNRIGEILCVHENAASRKIDEAEQLLGTVAAALPGKTPNRKRDALAARLKIISAMQINEPQAFEDWLDALIEVGFLRKRQRQ